MRFIPQGIWHQWCYGHWLKPMSEWTWSYLRVAHSAPYDDRFLLRDWYD